MKKQVIQERLKFGEMDVGQEFIGPFDKPWVKVDRNWAKLTDTGGEAPMDPRVNFQLIVTHEK